ncbi:LLM class flavin-dependent oxidoreductase [Actinophytocola oryzae]|uniref:Alkanesulfonate monooxygenase SsuD/methylene tetrahydromethanopterin reductase-like flavin-dependent oxidoreductase (Luciferase family) n=1 Tax=Actinophytocola oryzae TaxID=502181 RepID=A0A4R7W3B0_9PSEU|nr:LLM class flavin-dependent oxidoreductase [Actinophytocola oryzae]TDV56528.1 alkanesulfonate monooxygenase SsuD/methylene tetrahydromethanopterin reductase-like flavin-dependent oxidoreductase (luciferase family) [Actinophytocola oryzae]
MRLAANWLPISPELTREVARRAERAGLWGLGIGDSPHYGELYAACADALAVTSTLTVLTSVTNPVTRHVSVHASAARTFGSERFVVGMGRGDSAVRTFGLDPAPLPVLEAALTELRAAVPDVRLQVAASGPRATALAGRCADGVIGGAGRDLPALRGLRDTAAAAHGGPVELWASVRLAVAGDESDVPALRTRMLPRAISASRFNFAGTFDGKNVPAAMRETLTERYAGYDFAWHGRSGANPVATMFADRPDIEDYLLDRFAVVGTVDTCRDRLAELDPVVDGVFLSLLFEDAVEQLDMIGDLAGAL